MATASTTWRSVAASYDKYIRAGGEGPGNYEKRVASWGYDPPFLARCGIEEAADFLSEACGGGCPLRLDEPRPGETVLDLGCGSGHDLVIASRLVGPKGRVYGVDLSPEMVDAARRKLDAYSAQGELLQGAIDDDTLDLPPADVCVSNGVFNLCFDKSKAFATAFRALKPGGRFLLADVCEVPRQANVVAGCVSPDEYARLMSRAGFVDVRVVAITDFWTSDHTRCFEFTARKPPIARRRRWVLELVATIFLLATTVTRFRFRF
ncbi:hypothetical protein CTAYLR_002557 [Chrysophaeum taylorii]|uniref:Methyltransferase domain-containing protein n=1 Tax=Chrysophaeum taylorii TaxID=2483200 RepID=A0AAD7XJC2_9STRA|nr:hypothetical protein CTAYLR_002557 [Chrysophaeum taylorii]